MEYKVLHSADLEADLNAAAAEGWELFSDPVYARVPNNPALWFAIMVRSETEAMDFADSISLETIRDWAAGHAGPGKPLPLNEHARGYWRAVKDVQAILAVHGQPPGTPVHFGC